MSAALNALKGHLKLDKKLGDVIKSKSKGKRKEKGGNMKMKNKKNTGNKAKQKEDKAWKRCTTWTETRRARRWASTLIIGASIKWHGDGACASRLNVTWEKSGRRNSRR